MRSDLARSALDVAWSQWTALGIVGTAPLPDHAIDLEALILFTPMLRDEDPRLCDEALDWCVLHAKDVISVARLRHLRLAFPDDARAAYDEFAASVNATANPKTPWPTGRQAAATPMRRRSRAPDVARPALVQLRLRYLFGITARAEVLLQFLRPIMVRERVAHSPLLVSAFRDLGYSKPVITDVLNALVRGGLVEKWRRGNRDHYELIHHSGSPLVGLAGVLPATGPNWVLRFRVLASLLSTEAATRDKKAIVQAVAIVKQLEAHRGDLEQLAVKPSPQAHTWPDLAAWARRDLLDHDELPTSAAGHGRP
jgi:hypothetical protein